MEKRERGREKRKEKREKEEIKKKQEASGFYRLECLLYFYIVLVKEFYVLVEIKQCPQSVGLYVLFEFGTGDG